MSMCDLCSEESGFFDECIPNECIKRKFNFDYHCECGYGMKIVLEGRYAGVYECVSCGNIMLNENPKKFYKPRQKEYD